jgi:hypothetical protein
VTGDPTEIIVGGRAIRIGAKVRTWHEHGLTFPGLAKRTQTRAGVLHWTGGEGAPDGQLFRTMQQRKVNVHFAVDQGGVISQYVDADALCAHAHGANPWSWGIEIVNRGTLIAESAKWPRAVGWDFTLGKPVRTCHFYPAQMFAVEVLTRALCSAYGLPYAAPASKVTLPARELALFRGVLGHLHVNPQKPDPGNRLLDELGLRAA